MIDWLFIISASLDTILVADIFEEYRADSISVIVEWTRREGVSYNVTIVPVYGTHNKHWKHKCSIDSIIQH
jgi:hypothetical protein